VDIIYIFAVDRKTTNEKSVQKLGKWFYFVV